MAIEYFCGVISARLNNQYKVLARDVSFKIDAGESLALIGGSGSGKSIIACSIMKLLPKNVVAKDLKFNFFGDDFSDCKDLNKLLGDKIVYIPQNGHENLSSLRKVKYHLFDSLKKIGVPRSEIKKEAVKKLAAVGFANPEEVMEKYPFELSGGMAQRVVIAIGICSRAEFVIADEPTNGLEEERKDEFLKLIDSLFPTAAKLYITHDISVAMKCDKIIVLCGGRVMEEGFSKEVLISPKSPYTKALISALAKNRLTETPLLRENIEECPFYSRCKEATEMCVKEGVCKNA